MSLLSQLHHRGSAESVMTITVATPFPNRPPTPVTTIRSGELPTERRCIDDAQLLTSILLADADDEGSMAALEAAVDELVDVWTPAAHMTSRLELMSALADVDDAIGDVVVTFGDGAGSPRSAFVAWSATGRFVRPASLDDDRILEPDGSVIRLAGVTSVAFGAGHRAERIRCYYDRLALIEQLLRGSSISGAA
jgi:hypothetical protein